MARFVVERHCTWEVETDYAGVAVDLAQATPPDTEELVVTKMASGCETAWVDDGTLVGVIVVEPK